ncbi:MAG TPA: hypothetical protein VL175_13265 [Pirellulales bacterium]|jgi:tetratricopeptide (TPR) repeat protein|nr:hypothetical protein [Pirellulales bacterium]
MAWKVSVVLLMAFSGIVPPVIAEHPKSDAKPKQVGSGVTGFASEELPAQMDDLGDYEHRIHTADPLAQRYFNQGLRLVYAFNHDEAIRAFRAAAKIDPQCIMAQWGIALSLGPNYNLEAEKERSKAAYETLQVARGLLDKARPEEAAYVEALATRYSASPDAERKPLDEAYAAAMRKLAAKYPDDLDAAVLAAESMMNLRPWTLWSTDGKPAAGTEEIVSRLEAVLLRNPDHPGANHYYIHAVEASPQPERALASALRLSGMGPGTGLGFERPLMPGAGHLIHMPGHIYYRLGWYGAAADANKRAIEVDRKYIEQFKPEGVYAMMYYPHNIHFLWAALAMEGRSAEAITAADQVVGALEESMVREMPMLEYFVPTRLYTLVRFQKWSELAAEKQPAAEFTFANGMWHYAQGLACAAQGQSAEEHRRELEKIVSATPADKLLMRQSAKNLLQIAADELGAKLDALGGNHDQAVTKLRHSIALEDGLEYTEPPPWHRSMRAVLGSTLLEAKRPADAETALREDLKIYPENGWGLYLLARAVRDQAREAEAARIYTRFKRAWGHADFQIGN